MKRLSSLLLAIGVLLFISCSSDTPKEIRPTSADFISGELAKYIEVVDAPSRLTYVEKGGKEETQYIQLKVLLKLIKESPELQRLDARDIRLTQSLPVATVKLVDENNIALLNLNVKSDDLLRLKKLLQKKVGHEETIVFEGEFHNSKEASQGFAQANGFTPCETCDIIFESTGELGAVAQEEDELTEETNQEIQLHFTGMVGGANDAIFTYNFNTDEGDVVFTVDGVKNVRKVKMGSYDKTTNKLVMREFFANGSYIGDFDGIWKAGVYKGVFKNKKGGRVDFELRGNATGELPDVSSNVNEYSIKTDDSYTGSNDWDALLDAYERYADEYISYLRKAAKGDMSALSNYPALMEKAQKFSDKLSGAQGEMSAQQWSRYMKITNKMANAAQQMQ